MKFTVVIPTFNRRRQIGDAITSALTQRDAEVDVIVVDDGSTDGTVEWLLQAYAGRPLQVLANTHAKGPAGARNTGLLAAGGDVVALLDSDDAFLEGHLAAASRAFDALPEVDVLFGPALYERGGKPVDYMGPNFARKLGAAPVLRRAEGVTAFGPAFFDHLLANGCYFNLSTVVLRTPAARELMNESLRIAEDYEFWVRLSRTHRFACLDQPQIRYTLHDENISFEADASAAGHAPRQLDAFRIMRAYPGLTSAQARTIDRQMAEVLFDWGYRCRLHRQFGEARQLHWRSLRLGKRRQNIAALLKLAVHGLR